jgi:hypothetical protein
VIAIPSIIWRLARDPALSGRDMQIWVISILHLDLVDYRPLPLTRIVEEYNAGRTPLMVEGEGQRPPDAVSPSSVCRSLRRLSTRGYLERADHRGANRESLYRLPLRHIYPRQMA